MKSVNMMRATLRKLWLGSLPNLLDRSTQRVPWTPKGRAQFNAPRFALRYLRRYPR